MQSNFVLVVVLSQNLKFSNFAKSDSTSSLILRRSKVAHVTRDTSENLRTSENQVIARPGRLTMTITFSRGNETLSRAYGKPHDRPCLPIQRSPLSKNTEKS